MKKPSYFLALLLFFGCIQAVEGDDRKRSEFKVRIPVGARILLGGQEAKAEEGLMSGFSDDTPSDGSVRWECRVEYNQIVEEFKVVPFPGGKISLDFRDMNAPKRAERTAQYWGYMEYLELNLSASTKSLTSSKRFQSSMLEFNARGVDEDAVKVWQRRAAFLVRAARGEGGASGQGGSFREDAELDLKQVKAVLEARYGFSLTKGSSGTPRRLDVASLLGKWMEINPANGEADGMIFSTNGEFYMLKHGKDGRLVASYSGIVDLIADESPMYLRCTHTDSVSVYYLIIESVSDNEFRIALPAAGRLTKDNMPKSFSDPGVIVKSFKRQ